MELSEHLLRWMVGWLVGTFVGVDANLCTCRLVNVGQEVERIERTNSEPSWFVVRSSHVFHDKRRFGRFGSTPMYLCIERKL